MNVLALKTDQPTAEIYLINDGEKIAQKVWLAQRQLAKDLLSEVDSLLGGDINQLDAVVVFEGPGSFTGLRIGITVANTIAHGLSIPIVSAGGDNWLNDCLAKLASGENSKIVKPNYGRDPNTPPPKK